MEGQLSFLSSSLRSLRLILLFNLMCSSCRAHSKLLYANEKALTEYPLLKASQAPSFGCADGGVKTLEKVVRGSTSGRTSQSPGPHQDVFCAAKVWFGVQVTSSYTEKRHQLLQSVGCHFACISRPPTRTDRRVWTLGNHRMTCALWVMRMMTLV